MKLAKLVESRDALQKVAKMSLPIDISWNLKSLVFKVDVELKKFDEIRNETIIELGEEDETHKGSFRLKTENFGVFNDRIIPLLETEVDIPVTTIKYEVLKDKKDIKGNPILITTEELMLLDWLIVE